MKKYTKAQKKNFVAAVRMMKEPKPSKKVPRSTRVADASGPGGSLK